jgi:hypothetical protein
VGRGDNGERTWGERTHGLGDHGRAGREGDGATGEREDDGEERGSADARMRGVTWRHGRDNGRGEARAMGP